MEIKEALEIFRRNKWKYILTKEPTGTGGTHLAVAQVGADPDYTFISLRSVNNPFCCGVAEIGGWSPYRGLGMHGVVGGGDNQRIALQAFLSLVVWHGIHQTMVFSTLNSSDQFEIRQAMLDNGWKDALSFHNLAHGSGVSALAYVKEQYARQDYDTNGVIVYR